MLRLSPQLWCLLFCPGSEQCLEAQNSDGNSLNRVLKRRNEKLHMSINIWEPRGMMRNEKLHNNNNIYVVRPPRGGWLHLHPRLGVACMPVVPLGSLTPCSLTPSLRDKSHDRGSTPWIGTGRLFIVDRRGAHCNPRNFRAHIEPPFGDR
jgi:hypothetical protein